jgi:putative transposase
MYQWRRLSESDRAGLMAARKTAGLPWHSPPHWQHDGPAWFHLTAACLEHAPLIGRSTERMNAFANELLQTIAAVSASVAAWSVLPNHYHLLVRSTDLKSTIWALGQLHGRSSRAWNLEELRTGRKVFHRAADRQIRSDSHRWATLNYIHHNPVRHGYVAQWTDWPWSSANDFLRAVGQSEADRIWNSYPLLKYGEGWDDPCM